MAATTQPSGFDSTVQSISALAAVDAGDRWIMTSALAGVGTCHVITALGLYPAAPGARLVLAAGGAATALVAAFPLSSGGSAAHGVAAGVAFGCLAIWPALANPRRRSAVPVLRRSLGLLVASVLLGLVGWFVFELTMGTRIGLAERVAAGAQSLWPLAVAWSARRLLTGGSSHSRR